MTDKVQKIREEVVKLKSQLLRGACSSQIAMETRCKEEAYDEVLTLLDSMQEECNITGIKSRHATGKLKECIDNQTEEGLEQARTQLEEGLEQSRKQLEEESKAKFKVGDKLRHKTLKVEGRITNISENGSIDVNCGVYEEFGIKVNEWELVEKCEYAQKEADWLQELHCKLDSLSKEDFEKVWAKYAQKEEPVSNDLNTELDKYIKEHFTIDKEQLDRFGLEEKDYMYSMDKSDMLILSSHFANWQKQQMMKNAVGVDYDNLVAYDIVYHICKVLGKGGKGKLVIINED